jgi:flagellar biosynthesis/type III secretory pathway M-ring protein FliF/YscJ
MDFLNRALAPLYDVVKSMTPGARLMAAASLLAVAVGAAWMSQRRTEAPDTYLMGGQSFSATQLRDMEGALGKAGLVDYRIEGARVRVPGGEQSKYMAALADGGALPEDFGEHLKKTVNSGGFMLLGPRQEAQTKVAIQSDLQLVISRMKGIEKAFVHIAEETSEGFPKTRTVTASVGLEPRDNQAIDADTVETIRSFVASAWGGLKPAAVTVVDLSANRLFAGTPGGNAQARGAAADDENHKKQLELDWQDKIARVLGIAGVVVTANVEVDPQSRKPPRVSVWVAVPQTHYEQIWRKRHAAAAGSSRQSPDAAALAAIEQAEARSIQAAIVPLLGSADARAGRASQIAVSTIESPARPASAEPAPAERVMEWLGQNWQTLGFGGLILAGLLILRSTIKPVLTAAAPPRLDGPNSLLLLTDDSAEPATGARGSMSPRPLIALSESLREELTDRVREHPQAVASVLRNWIGNAS